jgi:hypothetical protein
MIQKSMKKATLQGAFFYGKIPKRNLDRASKTSWNGVFIYSLRSNGGGNQYSNILP